MSNYTFLWFLLFYWMAAWVSHGFCPALELNHDLIGQRKKLGMGCEGGGLIGYILLAYALLKWEVKVPERSGVFLMQPNCATWCQRWQQMLESEDRLSGASRQRFQPVCKETSSWRWNMWSGSEWGGGATFVGVRGCDIKRWDNAPASTVKSRDPLYWYWYENIPKYGDIHFERASQNSKTVFDESNLVLNYKLAVL